MGIQRNSSKKGVLLEQIFHLKSVFKLVLTNPTTSITVPVLAVVTIGNCRTLLIVAGEPDCAIIFGDTFMSMVAFSVSILNLPFTISVRLSKLVAFTPGGNMNFRSNE